MLRLVADVLRHPAFPAGEFEQVRRQMIQALEAQRQQAGPAASLRLQRQLDPYPPGHPRRVVTVDERLASYRAMTLDDVRQFHRDFYGAGSGQLAVVGDFDAPAVTGVMEELFASWRLPCASTCIWIARSIGTSSSNIGSSGSHPPTCSPRCGATSIRRRSRW